MRHLYVCCIIKSGQHDNYCKTGNKLDIECLALTWNQFNQKMNIRKLDSTKRTVLVIGGVAILVGVIGLLGSQPVMEPFFPLYIGLTLTGAVLLHKDMPVEQKNPLSKPGIRKG